MTHVAAVSSGARSDTSRRSRSGYIPPPTIDTVDVTTIEGFPSHSDVNIAFRHVFIAGDTTLLTGPRVAIVGARAATEDGRRRASRLARELAERDVVVVSGLAAGIDTAAHTAALSIEGKTFAVLGTPLDKAYPAENAALQERMWREQLLVSQFAIGARVHKSSFPERNRLMAAITHATVIIEASDTSGTLHQAAECGRMGKPLFIARSVVDNSNLSWPARFLDKGKPVYILENTNQVLDAIRTR